MGQELCRSYKQKIRLRQRRFTYRKENFTRGVQFLNRALCRLERLSTLYLLRWCTVLIDTQLETPKVAPSCRKPSFPVRDLITLPPCRFPPGKRNAMFAANHAAFGTMRVSVAAGMSEARNQGDEKLARKASSKKRTVGNPAPKTNPATAGNCPNN